MGVRFVFLCYIVFLVLYVDDILRVTNDKGQWDNFSPITLI